MGKSNKYKKVLPFHLTFGRMYNQFILILFCRLFEFRKIVKNREKCQALVDPQHPVTIVKVVSITTHL